MGAQLDTAPLGEFLAMAVAYIIDTRERMNRPPYMATEANIRNVVAQAVERTLEGMVAEGLLIRRRTINGDAYEFTPPKQTNIQQ